MTSHSNAAPPKYAWNLHLYQHPRTGRGVVTEGACDALTGEGYALIGTLMYCQPLVEDKTLVGTRYVFALEGREGTAHYDVLHASSLTDITVHEEPAVTADHETTDADRDADARHQQAADERYDTSRRYGR